MTMTITPAEWQTLLHTPALHSRGAPGREICKAAHGVSNARAVDRTIVVLRGICDKGLVRAPSSIYTFTTYFSRGYRRTEAGEAMVEWYNQGTGTPGMESHERLAMLTETDGEAPRERALLLHDCHTTEQAHINTDCGHPLRTTDPACSGCALRSDP